MWISVLFLFCMLLDGSECVLLERNLKGGDTRVINIPDNLKTLGLAKWITMVEIRNWSLLIVQELTLEEKARLPEEFRNFLNEEQKYYFDNIGTDLKVADNIGENLDAAFREMKVTSGSKKLKKVAQEKPPARPLQSKAVGKKPETAFTLEKSAQQAFSNTGLKFGPKSDKSPAVSSSDIQFLFPQDQAQFEELMDSDNMQSGTRPPPIRNSSYKAVGNFFSSLFGFTQVPQPVKRGELLFDGSDNLQQDYQPHDPDRLRPSTAGSPIPLKSVSRSSSSNSIERDPWKMNMEGQRNKGGGSISSRSASDGNHPVSIAQLKIDGTHNPISRSNSTPGFGKCISPSSINLGRRESSSSIGHVPLDLRSRSSSSSTSRTALPADAGDQDLTIEDDVFGFLAPSSASDDESQWVDASTSNTPTTPGSSARTPESSGSPVQQIDD